VSPRRPQLTAEHILAALNNRGVRCVVIVAFAAVDVVHSKGEAGRDKYLRNLPALRRFLRDHPDRPSGSEGRPDT
jgi:hypothetical protein